MLRGRMPFAMSAATWLTAACGLAVTALLFTAVSRLEYDKLTLSFEQRAAERASAIQNGLDDAVEVLTVTNQLFSTVEPVSREQFRAFTAPLLLRHPFIQAFNYHAVLAHAGRAAFEADMRRVMPHYVMRDMARGALRPVPVKDSYYVIQYIEPMAGNEAAFGMDVGPNRMMADALEQALTSGQASATGLLTLAQDSSGQRGFILLLPVYRAGMPTATAPQRRAALDGDTAAVIRATHLVHQIMLGADLLRDKQLALTVYASDSARPEQLIYRSGGPAAAGDASSTAGSAWPRWLRLDVDNDYQRTFSSAGKPWHVRVRSLPRPFLGDHLGSLSTLFGGILFSLLTAAFVQSLAQRSRRVQRLVDERTLDLKLSNEKLNLDVLARQRTELALLHSEQRFRHIAHHDVLTGLPNRALMRDRLAQAIAYANRGGHQLWVLLIDLDRFKFVNDSLGHKAGDLLLQTVATRLQQGMRQNDTVARLSGDEFVALLSEHPDEPLGPHIVRRLMQAVAQPVTLDGKEFAVTSSIGVAVYRPGDSGPQNLIEQADIAMYRAKKLGRDNIQFYTPEMNRVVLERVRIESALRNALARDEFVLHYQPQVDLGSGRVVGMEALLRWRHPELGMVAPARFIALAEETGLIVPIGAWVMRRACHQAKAWHDAGYAHLTMAVNLSARQFSEPNLVDAIAAILAESGLAPACLELELTESLFMDDVALAVRQLHEMKALGLKLSIDDFGTGYSSFAYLRSFPIDVLKIDRSFVSDIADAAADAAIVASIIALAHNLKLRVIAEGVETAQQLDYLRRHGCDEMQGYYFSRPLPADECEALLRSNRRLPAP